MNTNAAFISRLKEEGIPLNPGATEAELAQLESLLGIQLPPEVRDFYQSANGIPDDQIGPHMVAFWSINRIQQEMQNWADGRIGFADVMICSWRFIFESTPLGLMVLSENVCPGDPLQEIGSFNQFITAFLDAPESLNLL